LRSGHGRLRGIMGPGSGSVEQAAAGSRVRGVGGWWPPDGECGIICHTICGGVRRPPERAGDQRRESM